MALQDEVRETVLKYTYVTRDCRNLSEVGRHEDRLYAKYDHVKLVRAPRFTHAGRYVWEVA